MGPRVSVVLAYGLSAAVLAAGASAKTQLFVSGPTETAASGTTALELRSAPQDAAWARVTTFVPSGYTINLGQSAGTRIGAASAHVQPAASATGVVLVADGNDAAVQQSASQCTGTPVHTGVWTVRLTTAAQTLDIPVYVDPTTGAEAAFGGAKLVLCLPRATPVDDLKTTLSAGVFTNPLFTSSNVWRALVTPWAVGGTAPDGSRTVETQGLVSVPSTLSLKAKLTTTRRGRRVTNSVLLSGALLETLRGVSGATISIYATDRSAGSATTTATGVFAKRLTVTQRTTFRVTATVPAGETACVDPLPSSVAPAGCVSATRAGYRLRSGSIVVTPRKR